MAIITIARELGSLGDEVSEALAALTGYKRVRREYIEERLNDIGIDSVKRLKYDEKKPGFWSSVSQERDDFLHYLRMTLYEEAASGNCIAIGRGASAIFQNVPSHFSVKLIAPLTIRIQRVIDWYKCQEKQAKQIIEQSDIDRAGYYKYFFSLEWKDPVIYNIVINTADLPPDKIARLIQDSCTVLVGKVQEAQGNKIISELLLGQKIISDIIYRKNISIHFLDVIVKEGKAILHGVSNSQSSIDAALAATNCFPGIVEVTSNIQIVQEFPIMP